MYGRFDYYGVADLDQEMSLEEARRPKGLPKVGSRVKFQPNPMSYAMYSSDHRKMLPRKGGVGTVTTVQIPGGKKHYMPGPGGGLLYVKWDDGGVCGVAPQDIVKVSGGGTPPLPSKPKGGGRKARSKGPKMTFSYGSVPIGTSEGVDFDWQASIAEAKGKAVVSRDERKPAIVAAFKKLTKARKVTQVRDLGGGVFSANCLSKAVGGEGKVCRIRLDLATNKGELLDEAGGRFPVGSKETRKGGEFVKTGKRKWIRVNKAMLKGTGKRIRGGGLDETQGPEDDSVRDMWDRQVAEARSKSLGKGKYEYKGKEGVWRTIKGGDRVFFPDDKSAPMAMQGPKDKKPGLLKRIAGGVKKAAGAVKRALTREEIEAEIARLEATTSPFPEVRERRIEELRAELEEEPQKDFPKYKVGDTLMDFWGSTGVVRHIEGGQSPGYSVKIKKDKYGKKGRAVFWPRPNIKKKVESADVGGELLTERKQKLMTAKIRKDLPALYAQENVKDPMVYAKFFHPYGSGTWFATEYDGKDTFFGAVNMGHGWELGYFSLKELESLKGPGGAQAIERDQWFRPVALSKAKAKMDKQMGR
jgi:hypothetical protein